MTRKSYYCDDCKELRLSRRLVSDEEALLLIERKRAVLATGGKEGEPGIMVERNKAL